MTQDPDEIDGSRGAQTRRSILSAAVERFALVGYQSTKVSDIAREVTISPAAVYSYFPNKRALFEEAVDHDASLYIAECFALLDDETFKLDWATVFVSLIAGLPTHPLARRVLNGDEGKSIERLADLPAVADLRARLAAALRRGQAQGDIRADIDPELMALGIEAMLMSVLIAIVQVGGEPDAARTAGLLALLDSALAVPGGQSEQ
ncbi:MAG: TetR/AcrR family transcriptional regulator [Acidimicrobiia bacterium]|nr:TetR/AcrR family transcriptional regulator [Acidimicrobiia bacterium]